MIPSFTPPAPGAIEVKTFPDLRQFLLSYVVNDWMQYVTNYFTNLTSLTLNGIMTATIFNSPPTDSTPNYTIGPSYAVQSEYMVSGTSMWLTDGCWYEAGTGWVATATAATIISLSSANLNAGINFWANNVVPQGLTFTPALVAQITPTGFLHTNITASQPAIAIGTNYTSGLIGSLSSENSGIQMNSGGYWNGSSWVATTSSGASHLSGAGGTFNFFLAPTTTAGSAYSPSSYYYMNTVQFLAGPSIGSTNASPFFGGSNATSGSYYLLTAGGGGYNEVYGAYPSSSWFATQTSANLIASVPGGYTFYANTGLTVGGAISWAPRFQMSTTAITAWPPMSCQSNLTVSGGLYPNGGINTSGAGITCGAISAAGISCNNLTANATGANIIYCVGNIGVAGTGTNNFSGSMNIGGNCVIQAPNLTLGSEWIFAWNASPGDKNIVYRSGWSVNWSGSTGEWTWYSPSALLMYLDPSGNLGVASNLSAGGAGQINGSLNVNGNITTGSSVISDNNVYVSYTQAAGYFILQLDGSNNANTIYQNPSGNYDQCGPGAGQRNYNFGGSLKAYMDGGGNWHAASFNVISDAQLKTDEARDTRGLEIVRQLQPKTYMRVEGPKRPPPIPVDKPVPMAPWPLRQELGFVAQDVESILSEAVNITDGPLPETRTLNLMSLIAVLVNAVQELDRKVNQ